MERGNRGMMKEVMRIGLEDWKEEMRQMKKEMKESIKDIRREMKEFREREEG